MSGMMGPDHSPGQNSSAAEIMIDTQCAEH